MSTDCMKTVRDACQLQSNAMRVKLSDQLEQLDELISAEGNGTAFFDRTFIAQGMKYVITEGIAYGAMTPREWVAELVEYLAKRLVALRPDEANAARVLRELVKNQRLG